MKSVKIHRFRYSSFLNTVAQLHIDGFLEHYSISKTSNSQWFWFIKKVVWLYFLCSNKIVPIIYRTRYFVTQLIWPRSSLTLRFAVYYGSLFMIGNNRHFVSKEYSESDQKNVLTFCKITCSCTWSSILSIDCQKKIAKEHQLSGTPSAKWTSYTILH